MLIYIKLHTEQMLFHVGIEMEPFQRDGDFLHEIICEGGEDEYDVSHYLNDTSEGNADQSGQMGASDDTTEASIEIRAYIYVQLHEFCFYICSTCMKWIFLQASGSRKAKRKRGSKKRMEGHTTITSLYPDGEPKSPKGAKTTVVNQCGYYVRENIPINFKLWKKSKATDSDDYIVPEIEKEMLWADVK